MPVFTLSGVEVDFPFEPYGCQRDYMERVIVALQQGDNALLESPTGTGKTLCLLCAVLAWRRTQASAPAAPAPAATAWTSRADDGGAEAAVLGRPRGPPTIVYASRTHSQLAQVVSELKATRYRPEIAVLGSREQLCVHPKVAAERGSVQNNMCRQLGASRSCRFRNNLDKFPGIGAVVGMERAPQPGCSAGAHGDGAGGAGDDADAFALASASTNAAFGVRRAAQPAASAPASRSPLLSEPLLDIEELAQLGRQHDVCPFYLSRDKQPTADLVLLPYNYLLDASVRASLKVQWPGAVLIFDEAHNVDSVACDASSFELSTTDIACCVEEMQAAIDLAMGAGYDGDLNPETLAMFKALLLRWEEEVDALAVPEAGMVQGGAFVYHLLGKMNITSATFRMVLGELNKVVETLAAEPRFAKRQLKLESFGKLLEKVFGGAWGAGATGEGASDGADADGDTAARIASQCYRVFISDEAVVGGKRRSSNFKSGASGGSAGGGAPPEGRRGSGARRRTLSFWCFSPGLAFRALHGLGVRSLLLTSGTLSPLDSMARELALPNGFNIRLENAHVIEPQQVWVGVLSKGVTGKTLNSSYRTRGTDAYKNELGNTITNFARLVPGGLLVFFASYTAMHQAVEHWKASGTWARLERFKKLVVEPSGSEGAVAFKDAVRAFRDGCDAARDTGGGGGGLGGAALFAVCRGKVSEGIDFADDYGRAVVITGLPYAPAKDPRVKLKREYLDEGARQQHQQQQPGTALSGHAWYSQQATRAVNQAVGRVIRHRFDYGAVLLCDERFREFRAQQALSNWLQPHVRQCDSFGHASSQLAQFYKAARSDPTLQRHRERQKCSPSAAKQEVSGGRDSASTDRARQSRGAPSRPGQSFGGPRSQAPVIVSAKDTAGASFLAPSMRGTGGGDRASSKAPSGAAAVAASATGAVKPSQLQRRHLRDANEQQQQQQQQQQHRGVGLEPSLSLSAALASAAGGGGRGGASKKRAPSGEQRAYASTLTEAAAVATATAGATATSTATKPGGRRVLQRPAGIEKHKRAKAAAAAAAAAAAKLSAAPVATSDGGNISNNDSQTSTATKSDPKTFLRAVKCRLSDDQYARFKECLKGFKTADAAADSSIGRYVSEMCTLFTTCNSNEVDTDSNTPSALALLRQCGSFVPRRHRLRFNDAVRTVEQSVAEEDTHALSMRQQGQLASPGVLEGLRKASQARVRGSSSGLAAQAGGSDAPSSVGGGIATGIEVEGETVCVICRETAKDPFLGACGHICCSACWKQWLTHKSACPMCREPVQRAQLRRMIFH